MEHEKEVEQAIVEHAANISKAGRVEPNLGRDSGVGSVGRFAGSLAYGLRPFPSKKVWLEGF